MGLRDDIPESLRKYFFETGPNDGSGTGDDRLGDDEENAIDRTSPSYNSGDLPNPLAWVANNIKRVKTVVNTLASVAGTLRSFADSPLKFLRRRLVPIIVGILIGFTNILANAFAAPFEAIQTGLVTLGDALVAPFSFDRVIPFAVSLGEDVPGFTAVVDSDYGPIEQTFVPGGGIATLVSTVVNLVTTTVETATAPLGPLQPFGVAALLLVAGYAGLILTLRIGRALLDSVPGLSGIETFLFG